jgi:hypothetical protein
MMMMMSLNSSLAHYIKLIVILEIKKLIANFRKI